MPKILSIDDKLLAKLPVPELAGRFMALPARRRLEILLDRTDAEEVVKALAAQDFYFTVKELGQESSAPFLALASIDQLNHLLDLECWRGDTLLPGKALAWLEELATASGQKFLAWLYQADFELLVLLFKKWLDVELIEDEDAYYLAQDSPPRHTLDNQFYFAVRYPEYEELIKTILSFLLENHRDYYYELMDHIQHGTEAEIAELAYRFHRGRLEDNAIPDATEAATIYRPLELHRVSRSKTARPWPAGEQSGPPTYAVAIAGQHGLLAQALAGLHDPAAIETVQLELATLANKVVMADGLEPDEPENLRQSVEKVGAYVNLGLEEFAGPSVELAASGLAGVYLEDLFRLGHTEVARIQARQLELTGRGWISRWPHRLNILDREWFEPASLLLARTPMILRRPSDLRLSPLEDFLRTRSDLQQAADLVDILAALEPLFTACEQEWQDWERLADLLWNRSQNSQLQSVTLGTLLLTGAARQIATGRWSTLPLPVRDWPGIFPLLAPEKLEQALRDRSRHLLAAEEREKAERYLEPILGRYKTETGSFGTGQLPAPQFVSFFLFTEKDSL